MSSIKDLDKAFEKYSRGKVSESSLGLNKKIQNTYKGKEAIKSIEGIPEKLYKIMKFGGNLMFSDLEYMQEPSYNDESEEEFGTSDWSIIYYKDLILEYIDQCGCTLPFKFKIDSMSMHPYTILKVIDNMYEESVLTGISEKFYQEVIREFRASRIDKNDKKAMDNFCEEFNKNYFYLLSAPSEYFNMFAGRYRTDISKIGDFFIKVPRDFKDKEDTIHNLAYSLCVYFQKNMPEYYESFSEKIDSLFESLSNSRNKKCADAMREGLEYPDNNKELVVEIVREQ